MDFSGTLKKYYYLSKPGIIRANVLTAAAGYLLASKLDITLEVLLSLIVGFALVIAGSCAYNNYLDRNIDKAMARTKKRALVTGDISARAALTYATVTTLLGLGLLFVTQNSTTVMLAVVGIIGYVALYGYAKRKTVHGTLVGCISGSISLVAGYTAVVGGIDGGAVLLFFLMTAWQMAHFYGIALYRLKDYAAAKIPVMPVVYGVDTTKMQVIMYIVLFIIVSICLAFAGYVGIMASGIIVILGLLWLYRSVIGYRNLSSDLWGKRVFLFSLIVMTGMTISLAFGSYFG
jgi:heme o synthase